MRLQLQEEGRKPLSKIIRNVKINRDPITLSVDGNIAKPKIVKRQDENTKTPTKDDIRNMEKEMYERGFKDGYESARKEMIKSMEEDIEEMRRLYEGAIETFMSSRDIIRKEVMEQVIELIKKGVEKIIDKEISNDSSIVLSNLRKGIEKILNREKITIYMNPEDYEYMEADIKRMLKEYDVGEVHFVQDREMKRGGVRIESTMSYVDASIEGQTDELFKLTEE